ncbi:MAG: MipA/OmpV family protein [Marinobacterium sp.]|nr:MipA/OmpV family protein [Marinobacterium sp.]
MKQTLALLAAAGMSSVVLADSHSGPDNNPNAWQISLGAGVGIERSPYIGVGTETGFMPMLSVEKGPFYFHGTELGIDLLDSELATLTLLGHYRMEGFDASDSLELNGMQDRDGAFELGARAAAYTDFGELSLTVLADVSDEHDGYEVTAGWATEYMLTPQLMLSPSIDYSWRSDDLNNYYYGVRASEAAASRAAYQADADGILSLGISAFYSLDQQQSLMFELGVDLLGDEIKDSSIVERSNVPHASLAYLYRF